VVGIANNQKANAIGINENSFLKTLALCRRITFKKEYDVFMELLSLIQIDF